VHELDPSHALLALAPATAAAPLPLVKAAPTAPRLLSSRLGQNQLLTSPSAASRVRLPVGLDRMGETFSALVSICVTATGSVSRVSILRSAGPVLDPQIPKALSRWRYRPLVEAGTPTPFCYNLNYEISAR
jgi:TonB family protein